MSEEPVSSVSYDDRYFLTDCGGYEQYDSSRGKILFHCLRNGIRVWGIDYSESATRISRETIMQDPEINRASVAISRADAKQLPFRNGAFDRILLSDIVEHLRTWELDLLLEECARVLRAEGLVIIHTSPNRWYYTVRYRIKRLLAAMRHETLPGNARSRYEREMHVHEHTYFSLKRALGKCFSSDVWFADRKASGYGDRLEARKKWPFNCLVEDIWGVACLRGSRSNLRAFIERDIECPKSLDMGKLEAYFLRGDWYSAEYADPPMRWTGKKASAYLNGKAAKKILVRALCSRPNIETSPLLLKIRVNGKLAETFEFHRHDWETIEVPIEPGDRVSPLKIGLEVDKTWVPKELDVNDDPRELGIAVLRIWAES